MKNLFALFFLIPLALIFTDCNNHSGSPSGCLENPNAEGKLIVIVGEKIGIKEVEPETDQMIPYSKYMAHYKILQKICGDYDRDMVSFTVYDHYGFPPFGNYQHALLFLNNNEGTIYHEIYQYFPLYKAKDGRWASNYRYMEYSKETNVKPEKIEFAEEISFSIEGLTRAATQREFPEPFYRIDKNKKKAIAVWGNFVPELFQLKKDGVLKYRGFYGKVDSAIFKREVQIENIETIRLSIKDSLNLIKTWLSLLKAIRANDSSAIKRMSLDSIECSVCEGIPKTDYENNLESIDMFIDSANINFQKGDLWKSLQNKRFGIHVTKYPDSSPKTYSLKDNEEFIIFSINVNNELKTPDLTYNQYHFFQFVKIDNNFRFYTMKSH